MRVFGTRILLFALAAFIAALFCACSSVQNAGQSRNMVARVTTDAQGHVATVTIVKSSGSAKLDQTTVRFIKQRWSGPPNASKEVPFSFVAR